MALPNNNTSSTFLSMFQPVTYTFDNGVYSSIINSNNQCTSTPIKPMILAESHENAQKLIAPINSQPVNKKYVNPFDPEATVPLPLELEDQFGPYSSSVWKRNERERFRVRNVNDGYERLRKHLPVHVDEKRISKVDTLRLAIRYIRHLDNLLKNHLHQYNCKCFAGFQEESEGNISIDIHSFSFNSQHSQ